jgi:hypothetical protein
VNVSSTRKVWSELVEAITRWDRTLDSEWHWVERMNAAAAAARLDQESQRIEETDAIDQELSGIAAWDEPFHLENSISSTENS